MFLLSLFQIKKRRPPFSKYKSLNNGVEFSIKILFVMKCPYCNSTNVDKTVYHYAKQGAVRAVCVAANIGLGILGGMIGTPLKGNTKGVTSDLNDEYECHNCGREFSVRPGS